MADNYTIMVCKKGTKDWSPMGLITFATREVAEKWIPYYRRIGRISPEQETYVTPVQVVDKAPVAATGEEPPK